MVQFKRMNFQKKNIVVYVLFVVSVIFFLQVMMDLTWFEDELKGNWFIKRLILSSFLSIGYIFQIDKIKSIIPRFSNFILFVTVLFSVFWPIIGSPQTKIIFVVLSILIFLKNRLNLNEQN